MGRIVHTVAALTAGLALVVGFWQGADWIVVAKRAVVSYLAFFCIGGILALFVRLIGLPGLEAEPEPPETQRPETAESPNSKTNDAGTERAKSLTP